MRGAKGRTSHKPHKFHLLSIAIYTLAEIIVNIAVPVRHLLRRVRMAGRSRFALQAIRNLKLVFRRYQNSSTVDLAGHSVKAERILA
jgi:hypothetical protein